VTLRRPKGRPLSVATGVPGCECGIRILRVDQERSAEWPYWLTKREIEMNRSGGIGIIGVIIIVVVILLLVGVIKL
jgi:hypothetical protein